MESMCYQAFIDLKRSLGVERPFFPFGAASNASLLYILARVASTLPIKSVCEFGSGQTTLLLDALCPKFGFTVYSFEQHEFWGDQVRMQLRNPDRVTISSPEMVTKTIRSHRTSTYGISEIKDMTFNLFLVDGPHGVPSRSRWGSLEVIDEHLHDDFVIIFDDAQRQGEAESALEAQALLRAKGLKIYTETLIAVKSQIIITSESMQAACYY